MIRHQTPIDHSDEMVLDRLAASGPGVEIWWDSSPLVYEQWAQQMLTIANPADRAMLAEQLCRLYNPCDPAATLFRGVTTNPPLSLAALQAMPAEWNAWIDQYLAEHPEAGVDQVFWALYKEVVRQGAEAFRPVFEASGYQYGYLSGQVDPRHPFEPDLMLRQALELSAQAPNIMIKIPGTTEGLSVLRELTARGISTNCTSAYIVPQFVAVAEAVQAGLAQARAAGVDLTRWRSVVTDMSSRWENAPEFVAQAAELAVPLSAEDRRWAGVAIFKQAHRVFRARAYPSKMLICSVRMGPIVRGVLRCWHLEEVAGASAVFTLPPAFLTELLTRGKHLTFERRIWDDIPAEVMARLRRLPYFNQAYEPDGLAPAQFDSLPALLSTYREFSAATEKMIEFVRTHMEAHQAELVAG